jgi:hypothetical protein
MSEATNFSRMNLNVTYCTYFDSKFASRGIALIQSLRRYGDLNEVIILALDDKVEAILQTVDLGKHTVINWSDLTRFEPRLPGAVSERTKMESYFTATPVFVKYASALSPQSDYTVYLDGDLFFFNDPYLVFEQIAGADVGIIPHAYKWPNKQRLAKYGTFNVGWVGFRNTSNGQRVINWWVERCLEWCNDKPEGGKYADQGYLDWFYLLTADVQIMKHKGLNFAPWNSAAVKVRWHDGSIFVDRVPLVFFHFHGLRFFKNRWIFGEHQYFALASTALRKLVYVPYIENLMAIQRQIGTPAGALGRKAPRELPGGAAVRLLVLKLLNQTYKQN